MKTAASLSALRCALLGLTLALAINARAAVPATSEGAPESTIGKKDKVTVGKKKRAEAAAAVAAGEKGPASENEADLIDHAYGILSHGDHDYDGHRKRAMHLIEEAAKALGSHLKGDGRGDEKQGTSDTQLRKAESLLESAVGGLHGKPHRHIEQAIKQLNTALRIK